LPEDGRNGFAHQGKEDRRTFLQALKSFVAGRHQHWGVGQIRQWWRRYESGAGDVSGSIYQRRRDRAGLNSGTESQRYQ